MAKIVLTDVANDRRYFWAGRGRLPVFSSAQAVAYPTAAAARRAAIELYRATGMKWQPAAVAVLGAA